MKTRFALRCHLALKSPDGLKLIDSNGGGGNTSSWDSRNKGISDDIGTNRGSPKQLFQRSVDLGEAHKWIPSLRSESAIRSEWVATLDSRVPDNDVDGMSNSKWEVETANGREFSKSSIYQRLHSVDE
jgi:hypothetical protein